MMQLLRKINSSKRHSNNLRQELQKKWEFIKSKTKQNRHLFYVKVKIFKKIVTILLFLDKARMRAKEHNLQALRDNYEKMQDVCIEKIQKLEQTLSSARLKL